MKVYQCDSCKQVTDEPRTLDMKEFVWKCSYTEHGVMPEKGKQKIKIHLCERCFKGLSKIAEEQLQEDRAK